MNWTMPAETAEQERIWMAFPPSGPNTGETPEQEHAARTAWAAVAHAILPFQPVSMIVDPADVGLAADYLDASVELHQAPLDDAWMRDIGPSFVTGPSGELGAVLWHFNGWGQQDWAEWGKDSLINAEVAMLSGAQPLRSAIVNEGGGFHLDGEGTVLLTETVQLDPLRNPNASKAEIEMEIHSLLGTRHAVWLPRGLVRDAQALGTKGHVDIVATIPSPGTVLLHDQQDPAHPDFEVCAQIRTVFENSTDAAGRPWRIVPVPAPKVLEDEIDFVDYSYINHLVINGAVIACTFDDPNDAAALAILAEAYPGRQVIGVDAREIFARGGGIHCITQQQPARGPHR
ncbi:agmatine deiminase [Arthrobacter russicus]|uniref:Agmatine deiminase n=2 Tax=Arthrobacter russicus TaxID=172040 RepID=A0ABU1JD12_9MICC|nr:agmatine deiminase [Arthrobacter russicus]